MYYNFPGNVANEVNKIGDKAKAMYAENIDNPYIPTKINKEYTFETTKEKLILAFKKYINYYWASKVPAYRNLNTNNTFKKTNENQHTTMKIRATKKLLNIARIKVIRDLNPLTDEMPGEWYASIVSMGMPGKLAIHFLHYPTFVSVIIPEKSLNKAIKELPDHLASLLKRLGFSKMFAEYQSNTLPEIYSTNSRSMLAYMHDMSYNIEHHLLRQRPIIEIENIEFENLFGGKLGGVDYITPKEILSECMNKMVSR